MSNNLNITDITTGQNQKETTANNQKGSLDAAITEVTEIDVTAGNITVTATEQRECAILEIIGATTAGRTVTLDATKRLIAISSRSSDATQTVGIIRGSTTINLLATEKAMFYIDGTANGLFQIGAAA